MLVVVAAMSGHISSTALQKHALELRQQGYTVVPDAGLSLDLVQRARTACSAELARCLDAVEELGLDAAEDTYAFAEVARRHRLRWSMSPSKFSAWTSLLDDAVQAASPILDACAQLPPHPDDSQSPLTPLTQFMLPSTPTIEEVDAIVSRPGAKAQIFHADAGSTHIKLARHLPRHRLFNVFVPLQSIEADADGTQLWPGSHLDATRGDAYYDALERSGRLEDDELAMSQMVSPACPAGGLLLFDFRLLHRGMPNDASRQRERLLAHAVVSTGLARDGLTSSRASLFEAVDALPRDPTERRAARTALSQRQRDEWRKVRESSYR